MAKRTVVTAAYQMDQHEAIEFSVAIDATFPDAVDEAKAVVLGGLRQQLADVIALNHPSD